MDYSNYISDYENSAPKNVELINSLTDLDNHHVFEGKPFKKMYKNKNGVYIIRAKEKIKRLKGESRIIYVGSGALNARLIALFDPYFKKYNNTTKRLHTAKECLKRIKQETNIEIEVLILQNENKHQAETLESSLIKDYCKQHIEPPPLNNTRK